MATPEQPQSIHLLGRVPAVPATDLKVGDQLMYHGGSVYEITKIEDASPKFFKITEISTQKGTESTRRVKKDRPAARVPEEYRRPIGYQDAPADSYRLQVRAPEYGEWVTVGYGATVEEAADGLTPSRQERHYFGTVMLDRHGLGWTKETPDGRETSVKAMTDGETLTAEDGHSFRILPPEQSQQDARPTAEEIRATVDASGIKLGDLVEYDSRTVQTPEGPQPVPGGRGHVRDVFAGQGEIVARVEQGDGSSDAPPLEMLRPVHMGPARAAVEGTVLPAGHTLGIPTEFTDNANVRDAYGALMAAGHTPAELSNRSDDGVDDTAFGTGFVIYARESAVQIGHLIDGVDMWNALPDTERRKILRAYRDTMRGAGWETDGRVMGRRLHAWRSSPLPEGVTAAQTRGEEPQELPEGPVKVRFSLSDETLTQLRESGDRARAEHRAEFDERKRREAAERAPLPVGTRVRHAVQAWATSVQAPKGTAVVTGVGRQHSDGSFEYQVLRGWDISRRIGPDNPMDTPDEWNSARVRKVAPPRFEVRQLGERQLGVWDIDTELWVAVGHKEHCEVRAEGLNTGALTLDEYGYIQRPEPAQAD